MRKSWRNNTQLLKWTISLPYSFRCPNDAWKHVLVEKQGNECTVSTQPSMNTKTNIRKWSSTSLRIKVNRTVWDKGFRRSTKTNPIQFLGNFIEISSSKFTFGGGKPMSLLALKLIFKFRNQIKPLVSCKFSRYSPRSTQTFSIQHNHASPSPNTSSPIQCSLWSRGESWKLNLKV